jgi:DNA-binding MarR family transcriptional regulator
MPTARSTAAASPPEREALLAALSQAMRSFNNQVSFYSEAVAATVGIHPTDLDCLSVIALEGGASPGRLADVSGLTSGAITGVIDRLERDGFVRRRPDPTDRRKVLVEPVPEAMPRVAAAFVPMLSASSELAARYDDDQLATIIDYVTRATPMLHEETLRLRDGLGARAVADEEPGDAVALHGSGAPEATLRFVNGAARMTVVAARGGQSLVSAQFRGGRPTMREAGDTVTVQYRRSPFAHFRTSGTITLDADRRWHIEINGGLAHSTLDLRETDVASVSVKGGISSIELHLPAPAGRTTVDVVGGVNAMTITRPDGVPARVRINGGATNLVLDDQRFRAVGGEVHLASPQQSTGDAVEVSVRGGSRSLSVVKRPPR